MLLTINLILVIGITLSAVIIFLLAQKKDRAHFLLAIIFGFLLIICVQTYADINNIYNMEVFLFPFADVIGYVIGPLIYLYIISIYGDRSYLMHRKYVLFVPLLLCLLMLTIPQWIVFFGPENIQSHRLSQYVNFITSHNAILDAQALFLITCCVLSLRRLKSYRIELKKQFSDLEDRDIHWVRTFCILLICLLSLFLILEFLDLGSDTIGIDIDLLITILLVGMIGYLGYFGTAQSHILLPKVDAVVLVNDEKKQSASKPHHLSGVSQNELIALEEKLTHAMLTDQLFLQPSLSLAELASHIGTTDKKLSALLNHHINVTFYDFINKYRVDLVKDRLIDPEYKKYSILGIALDSGFSSKASFNRIFKQLTEMSPSQYKSSETKIPS